MLTREVKAVGVIAEFRHQWQCEKERERKEWDKLVEGGQPVKRERTTNNPIEPLLRIRYGSNYKEDS